MTSAIAVFVKTPGRSAIKTRLAEGIGSGAALEFYRRSLCAVEAVIRSATSQKEITAYWAVAENEAIADSLWAGLPVVPQGAGTLGERLARVYSTLQERHEGVVFLGADSPQISAATLLHALAALSIAGQRQFALGRCPDGGFYLFAGGEPLPDRVWTEVSWSTSRTGAEFAARLRRLGTVVELAMACDVDLASDLPQLALELAALENPLPEQRSLLDWLSPFTPSSGGAGGARLFPGADWGPSPGRSDDAGPGSRTC